MHRIKALCALALLISFLPATVSAGSDDSTKDTKEVIMVITFGISLEGSLQATFRQEGEPVVFTIPGKKFDEFLRENVKELIAKILADKPVRIMCIVYKGIVVSIRLE